MYLFVLVAAGMAFYFGLATLQRPRPAEILAVILWAAYAVYEYFIANGTLCDANCNIRVDLVLFFPLLGAATYVALKQQPRTGAVATLYVISLGLAALLAGVLGYTIVAAVVGLGALVAAFLGIKSLLSAKRA